MRFIEIPALITEDIEDPSIVDITEPITVSISGTTMTIDGGSKVSGEATVTLTGDTTVNAFTLQNIRAPSLHKISVKTNKKGNFTYVPNDDVTASSLSTTSKTGSDFEILLITTTGGETYVDFDMADYTSPALYTSNALTGFDISELTSTYGATAKLYKPDGTLLTTVTSAEAGSSVNFGYTESTPGDVTYTLEVTDDLGRTSRYDLPRKWISYAMSAPGFEKLALAGNEYTTTTMVPNLTSSSKARVYKTGNHGYLGINFKIQGRNSTNDAWVDVDDTGENENADESKEFLAFGDFLYHRVWVKPTAKATTSVSSSNVVTLTLSNLTEENVTTSFTGADPFDINESTNTYVFEETTKIGTIPFTVTLGGETYTNAVSATTEEIGTVPNTDFSTSNAIFTYGTSGGNQAAMIFGSDDAKYLCVCNPADTEEMFVYKGDPSTGSYALYGGTNGDGIYRHADYVADATPLEGSAMSWDGKYMLLKKYYRGDLTIFKNNESTSTYEQLIANHTATEATTASWGASAFIPNSYDFVMTRHAYADYGFRVVYFENSGDTWTEKWTWENPNSGGLTHSNSDTKWGRFGFQFSKDKKYAALTSYANPTSVAVLKVDLENTTTQNKFEKIWEEGITQGYACAMSPDGKYIIAGNQKIFKNNDAGDWTTKTEVQSEFTNNTIFTDYCIFLGDKYVAGGNSSSKHLFEFYPKNSVTLTFSNPTLTLTGQNVTISSAKLYRDDVLFHTYGTESNVVLRSDQTGTYQAIVNDVYYSNRVTPDFTTTRSVSAPQLEFDGYNKLTLANYITTTSDFPSIITFDVSAWSGAPTTIWYVLDTTKSTDTSKFYETNAPTTGDAGNDGTQTGIEFRCESDGTTKVYANTDDNTGQPNTLNVNSTSYPSNYVDGVAVTSGDVLYGVEGTFTRFGFNVTSSMLFTRTVITPTSSTLGLPDGTTRDLTTQSNVYIYETGTYTANVQTSDTFAYLSNVVTSQPSQNPTDVGPTFTFDGYNRLAISNLTQTSSTLKYGSNTYDTNTASNVYVTDTGEYILEARDANTFVMSNVYVGAVDTIPEFTLAFHHGTFADSGDPYSDGSVTTAATNGHVFADTTAGTYSWGTLAHVKERENPDFTANSTLHTDYNSTYGWTTNSGWEVSAKDESSSTYAAWKAFSKTYVSDNNWLSGSAPSTSSPQWLKIKYPSAQVIKSYVIRARDNASPRFPTAWKLQGSNNDSDWTDIGSEQTQTEWVRNQNKSFELDTNTTAYQYYRLRITGAKESASSNNSDYVAIGHWFLLTETSGSTVHTKYTRYTYTPASTITANVLRVAGGGGGSGTRGGGGGAGGLLYSEGVSLSGTKSIVVGNGGIGYEGTQQSIENGYDTVFTGLTTSIGGGHGGGNDAIVPTPGGSGGGGSARIEDVGTGAAGTSGQGNAGGDGSTGDTFNGGGGGGAGGIGGDNGGVGGVGLDYSSVFGTTYGDSGWFAGGGGGGNSSGGNTGGNGGGGGGSNGHGTKHTGGGGAGIANSSSTSGDGGSGIVLIKKLGPINPPALTFDGYNKLTIENVDTVETATIKKDDVAFATTTSNTVYIRDTGTYTAEVKGSGAYAIELSKEVTGNITNNPSANFNKTLKILSDHYGHNEMRHVGMSDDGTWFAVGSPMKGYDGSSGSSLKGVLQLYKKSNGSWSLKHTFESSSYHNFGRLPVFNSTGTRLFVVAYYNDSPGSGAFDGNIHVYDYNSSTDTWSESSVIYGGQQNALGMQSSVCNDDGTVLVVSYNAGQAQAGGYKIYERNSNTGNFDLKSTIGNQYDVSNKQFGISISMDGAGTRLLIGGLYGKVHESNYDSSTSSWSTPTEVLSKTANFGYEIEIARDLNTRAAIRGRNTVSGEDGIYDRDSSGNWTQTYAFDLESTNSESKVMRMNRSGTRVILGNGNYNSSSGRISIYDLSGGTWSRTQTILNPNTGDVSGFGYGLAMARDDGNTIVIASPYDNEAGTDWGAVYVYDNITDRLTYDGKNKITLNQLNYADTANVTYYSNTYELGTAKTMYVKDAGEYVFRISGTDKYVESNVYVSSVDLAGASTKPIDFDGYNKLTLIDAGSNVSANVTYYSNTYELGSANVLYINGAGTYDLEMSGSNVFALSSNVTGTIFTPPLGTNGYTFSDFQTEQRGESHDNVITFEKTDECTSTVGYWNTSDLHTHSGHTCIKWDSSVTYDAANNYGWSLVAGGCESGVTLTISSGQMKYHVPDPWNHYFDFDSGRIAIPSPSLTFDNYNKLTLENFTTPTLSDVNSANASATKVSGGGTSPDASSINSHVVLSNGDKAYHYNYTNDTNLVRNLFDNNTSTKAHGESLSAGEYYEWGYEFVSSKKIGSMTFKNWTQGDTVGNISIYYYDGTTWKSVVNPSASGYDLATEPASYSELEITFDPVTATHFKIWVYAHPQSSNTNTPCLSEWTLKSYREAVLTDPNDVEYTLGQTQNDIYIEETGDYFLEVTNSDQSAVVKKNIGAGQINPNETFSVNRIYIRRMFMLNPQTTDGGRNFKSITLYNGNTPYLWSSIGSSTYGGWEMYGQSIPEDSSYALKAFDDDITTEFTWSHDRYSRNSSGTLDGVNAVDYSNEYAYRETNSSVACTKIRFDAGINGGGFLLVLNQSRLIYVYSETAGNTRQGVEGVDHFVIPTSQTPFYIDLVKDRPTLTFNGYNKLSINNLTPTSTRLTYGSNTYDIGTASNVYIEDAGTYKVATGDATTFALVSNVVGAISDWETSNIFGFPLTSSIPSASNYSDVSTIVQGIDCEINNGSLKATNSSQSANDRTLYFHTTADYEEFTVTFDFNLSEVGSEDGVFFSAEDTASNMTVELQKYGVNTIRPQIQSTLNPTFTQTSGFSDWAKLTFMAFNKTSSRPGRVKIYIDDVLKLDQEATTWTTSNLKFKYFTLLGGRPDGRWALPNARMKNFKFYNHTTLYDTGPSLTYDTSNKLSITGITPTATTLTDPNGSSLDIGTASNVYIRDSGKYAIASKDANTFVLTSNTVTGTPTGTTYVYDSNTFTTPSQTYDTTKTITVSNVPSTLPNVVGKIYKGSTAYTIHATTSTSNVIIKNTGSYVSVFTTSSAAYLTNTVNVNATPTTTSDDNTIEDEATLVTTTVTVTVPLDGSSADKAAENAWALVQLGITDDGLYWIDLPTIGPTQVYCILDTSYDGGGWMLAMKATRGTTFSFGANYWTTDNTLNETDVTLNDADAKYEVFNKIEGTDLLARWPDIGAGGSINYGGSWTWLQNGYPSYISQTSSTLLNLFQTANSTFIGDAKSYSGYGSAFSSQTDVRFYGFNYNGNSSWNVRWGFGWNENGGGLYPNGNQSSNDVGGGIGMKRGSYSAGDYISCCQDSTGINRTARVEMYVRSKTLTKEITTTTTTTTTTGGLAGSTAVPSETVVDTPSATLDATDTTVTEPTLNLDFTTPLPRTLKRYNGVSNSSIGARFNRRESRKKRIEKSISIPSSFSAELTANNASSPTTLTVTVANSKFVINGDETPTLGFIRGETYTFDQSDSSNSGHPLVLATSVDGTIYESGWVNSVFTVPYDVPDTIYYKCTTHTGMGGEIHTTFGNAFSLDDFTVAANTHVSGEYTLAVNYDGTTSNLYVNGSLITQTTPTPTISAGTKDFILGKEFDGYVKNFKFWNKNLVPVASSWGNTISSPHTATIPFTSDSTYDPSRTDLRYDSTINGDEYLHKVYFDNNNNSDGVRDIKFKVSTRKWMDAGTGDPDELRPNDGTTLTTTTENPEIVEARNGGSMIFKFVNPYYDSTNPNGLTYSMSNN